MAADRPKRRITQPCLEYNGGLLPKEEIMLRKAMYASLVESKKPSPKKIIVHPSSTENDGCYVNGVLDNVELISAGEEINGKHCAIPNEVDNNNSPNVHQFEDVQAMEIHSPSSSTATTQKKTKIIKEPSKLLNYVLKKKKEKKNKGRSLFRTPSPLKLQAHGDSGSVDFSGGEANVLRNSSCLSRNGKVKKKKRQRGALAVFVAMNKSAGGKLNKSHSLSKELLMKTKKKRRRRQKSMETQACGAEGAVGLAAESEELPTKKYKKDEKKKPHRMVQAQRKFAKRHPLSPNSMRYQVDNNLFTAPCTRAKTEDFLTFLCLRSNPVLPKELEVFNNPCLPMSPLSEEEDDISSPPSPVRSQSSMSNSSSAIQISHSDSPVPSVDSPATGEGPSWESGVVRMYADGPKGLAAKGKEEKKYDELLPSDEADSPRDLTKSVTPPLAFRVSSRPTNLSSNRVKDKQLPRPIPKPFAVKPSLTGSSLTRTSSSHLAGDVGCGSIPPPPSFLQSSDSSSCSPPPPPLLYIPAAAQRVTHLHGPPTLQRFPSTSPTRDQESTSPSEVRHRLTTIQDDGPPPLKRYPPVDVEREDVKRNNVSKEPSLRKAGTSEFQPILWTSNNREKKDHATVETATFKGSNSSVCDLTKISEVGKKVDTNATTWKSKEMPLLRRHSSASEVADVRVEDHLLFSGASRRINSSSSPPRLQRVPISVDTATEMHLNRVVSSGNLTEPTRKHIEASRSRYSPNFPSHPPRLVRHSPSHLGRNASPAFLQNDSLNIGVDPSRRQSSPFFDLASSKPVSAQPIQETPLGRTIPVGSLVSARHSPLFTSSQARYKSTYVFSNRQTYVQPVNETRPLPVSALMVPTANGVNVSGNHSEVNAMRLQLNSGFSRLNEWQLSHPVQNPCPSPSSSSYIHRGTNLSVMPENRQLSNSPVGFKRIPSPRSDLFSGISSAPVDISCMSHAGPKIDSTVSGVKPWAFQPSLRQKENSLGGLPPTWSHLQSPYSIPSVVSRSSPKPYTFSANLSQASRHSGSYSVLHSNAGTLERYSVGPSGSSDCQYVSVIQRANANKGEPSRREIWTGEQGNVKTFQLPKAFQGGDMRYDASSNALLNNISSPDASKREQSSKDHLKQVQSSVKDFDSGNLNRQTPSASSNHEKKRPPTSDSPRLKAKKDKVAGSTKCVNTGSKVNSPPKVVKKTLGSKQKEALCSLPVKPNDSPVFYPSEEEFRNPVAYINAIRGHGEKFGICVICPPESWKPEFQVSDNLRFNSECQLIHKLQDRWGPVEEELACIRKHLDQQSISLAPMPQIGGYELDLPQFSRVMKQFGGLQKVIDNKKWTKIAEVMKIPRGAQDRIGKLQDIYCKYLLSYDLLPQEEKDKLLQQVNSERKSNNPCEKDADSWSMKGRNLSLVPFQRLARNVQEHFFKKPPLANDVEREFWKLVHNRDNYISVHRGSVDTNQENSGFPTEKGNVYSKNGWNLNVLPHLPGSVLKHLGFVQDVTVPWLQFDMIFSAISWQTHPLALYTVDYLHNGGEKIWYSVPVGEKKNFLSVCGQRQSGATETTEVDKMVSPSSLSDNGVTVTRVVQKEGQFVIVFPNVYYSSISCGYSISEAVAFATPDWVVLGCKRYKELQGTSWWSEFALERLLLGLAEELTVENQEILQCLLTELKSARDEEKSFMVQLLELGLVETHVDNEKKSSGSPGGRKGKKSTTNWPHADSGCVLYCEVCDRPCYVSAVTSEHDPQVLCLKHAVEHIRQKASPEGFKILTRYDTSRLEELVRKIEEKLKNVQTSQTAK